MKTNLIFLVLLVLTSYVCAIPKFDRVLQNGDGNFFTLINLQGIQVKVNAKSFDPDFIGIKIPHDQDRSQKEIYLVNDEAEIHMVDPIEMHRIMIQTFQKDAERVGTFYETIDEDKQDFNVTIEGSTLKFKTLPGRSDGIVSHSSLELLDNNSILWEVVGFMRGKEFMKIRQLYKITVSKN